VTRRRPRPPSYLDRLLGELEEIRVAFIEVLEASTIVNIDPNRRRGSGVVFIGYPKWGWASSDDGLESIRMALLRRVRDWTPCFRLLFPHPIPTVSGRLNDSLGQLERWLVREHGDHSVPKSLDEAARSLEASLADLRGLAGLVPADQYPVRLVPDTNTLVDNPDLAAYTTELGGRYIAHLLPVVLRELDDLKRAGRTPELRAQAQRADRRLKGLRDNGDVRTGARVAGEVRAVFEYIEPKDDRLPSWLDLTVPDDRFVAASLLLQSRHPGSAVSIQVAA
jgi:hypothetical protein